MCFTAYYLNNMNHVCVCFTLTIYQRLICPIHVFDIQANPVTFEQGLRSSLNTSVMRRSAAL